MRIPALIVLLAFCLANIACEVILQPSQQGEWSDFHNSKHKITGDATPGAEKKPEAKI